MIERTRNALQEITDQVIHVTNTLFQHFGLRLVNASYYDELLRTRYEHFFMAHRIEQLEEELEELREAVESEVQA